VKEPIWLIKAVVLAFHEEQLAEHGGRVGLREESLLDSALDRPKNQFLYDQPDIFQLAAAYGYGLAKNHPFLDGNKRMSLVACETFLNLNGFELLATDQDVLAVWLALAGGGLTEVDLAQWLRTNSSPT